MQLINKIKEFFKEVYIEGKKVDWPTKEQTLHYTAIVIGTCIVLAIFLGLADYIFLKLIGMFIL